MSFMQLTLANGWTRGQFRLYRILFGLYLLQHFIVLLAWGADRFSSGGPQPGPLLQFIPSIFVLSGSPLFVALCLGAGAVLSLLFTAGKHDRRAAVALWYLWACLLARNPLISHPSLSLAGCLLLTYLLVPSASAHAAARPDSSPRKLPGELYVVAWVLLALACAYSGYTRLIHLSRIDGSTIRTVDFTGLPAGMLALLILTFDLAWIPARRAQGETILFDGDCALCHGFVTFVLEEDNNAQPFRFSPLQGDYVKRVIPEATRSQLPDSVVLLDTENRPLVESAAVIYVLQRLGGLWTIMALLLWLVPRPLRDLGYRAVAKVRKKIFGTTKQMCPVIAPSVRGRFEM
jgi:predicted DCC family thiol-disulfide oxidoreductase YuxK